MKSRSAPNRPSPLRRLPWLGLAMAASLAQAGDAPVDIHLVYMGGNDCPPCVAWRRSELPQLERKPVFAQIRFSYVTKAVRSSVPPAIFLPPEVKPLKAALDQANGGHTGSPQTALLVNGKVYDYYRGTRSADQIERMLLAVRDRTPYPFAACARLGTGNQCAQPSPTRLPDRS